MRQETRDRKQKTGNKKQETRDRRHETGNVSQETSDGYKKSDA